MSKYLFEHKGLKLPRRPHNAQGEDLLGSFYRVLNLTGIGDTQVGAQSKNLYTKVFVDGFKNSGSNPHPALTITVGGTYS